MTTKAAPAPAKAACSWMSAAAMKAMPATTKIGPAAAALHGPAFYPDGNPIERFEPAR
jgi:hypothetical protein